MKQEAAAQRHRGFFAVAEIVDLGLRSQTANTESTICWQRSRRRLAHFELGAHLLDLRGLLFELRGQNFHSFLLLGDGGLQFLDFLVLFEEFIE